MTDPLPTFTVGVGQAGIAMMNALAETVERNDSSEFFNYIAFDTDGDTLQSTPDGTKQIRLTASDAHLNEDKATYPYLTEEAEVGDKGAERQRPVGRYKLDSRGHRSFDDYFETLWNEVREHYQEVDYTFAPDEDSYNIILLHSLGGGTGSGTFPLITAMVNQVAEQLDNQNTDLDVFVAGVGVIPKVDFDPSFVDPPGESMYYPNSYAALSDVSNLLDADNEPLDIPLYSKSFGRGGQLADTEDRVEDSFSGNGIPIDRDPFNDYWLVGVDENLIRGGYETNFIEGYAEQINRRVAESIYALSEMEQSVENWSSRAKGESPLGTIGHAQIKVPHEEVRSFCEMKQEREENRTLVEETIPQLLDDLRSEKDDLEAIKQNPENVTGYIENSDDKVQEFRGKFESLLGAGNALVRNSTRDEIERVINSIEDDVRPDESEEGLDSQEGKEQADESEDEIDVEVGPDEVETLRSDQRAETLLLATEILDEMLEDPAAAPAVEEHWEDVVSKQWSRYNLADKAKYGGSRVTTLRGKADALKTFYSEKIDEFEEQLENVDLDLVGKLQDIAPPWHPLIESDREEAERKIDAVRDSRDTLLDADGRYNRVQDMKEAVRSERKRAKQLLDEKVNDVNSLITECEGAKEEAQNRIKSLDRSIEQEKDVLAGERTGERLGIFPLRRDKLDELTLSRLENELDSLDQYVTQGFIDERKVRNGISTWLDNATGWRDPVAKMDYSGTDRNEVPGRQEMWLLFHDDNEEYAREGINKMTAGTTRRSGSNNIDYINDPYSILFVSFYNRGPVEGLTVYQRLDSMAEQGKLDSMAGKYNDYRQSFAYPEWYDRDIRMAFQIKSRATIPEPPELDLDRVKKPDLSAGEKKNFIKRSGLDAYMWQGTMWDDYEFTDGDSVFDGWERTLEGITYTSLQQATPNPDLKSRWIAGQADWEDILEAYKKNLEDREEFQIIFE